MLKVSAWGGVALGRCPKKRAHPSGIVWPPGLVFPAFPVTIVPMQWFVHGKLANAVKEALVRHEDVAHTAEELALPPEATRAELLGAIRARQWDLITDDDGLIDWIYANDFWVQRSVVYLQLTGGDVEQDDAVDRLFARYKRLTPARLYIVTAQRVKVRQLPAYRPGVGHE